MNAEIWGTDPKRWPLVTKVYRLQKTGNSICSAFRYESADEYTLVGPEPAPYCHHCHTSMVDSYGAVFYTRSQERTWPMYICVSCVDKEHFRPGYGNAVPLVWHGQSIDVMFAKISAAERKGNILTQLLEFHNCVRLREFRDGPLSLPPEFHKLMQLARKI